ncbi:DNA (cytosine-5)-methyltransferase 1 [Hamadaea flava]|uniref:Uncharacterized protein n=1 Tax=Hamadaea flava TaxID=1742688 RepID=A0ABV8LJR6_9ACTN|nr:hypothetical protein [Hamadaea flava]MCP2323668.1 DNA (cytosine-5)-methyltransferase 1 [Hamadaea flava]
MHTTPNLDHLPPAPGAGDSPGTSQHDITIPIGPQGRSQPLLPTPRASDTGTGGRAAGPGFRPPLSQVLIPLTAQTLLPTPKATDGTKGSPAQRGSAGDLTLPSAAVQLLPTPTAARYGRNKSTSAGAAIRPGLDSISHLVPTPTDNPEHTDPTSALATWGLYSTAILRWETILDQPAPAPTEPGRSGSPVLAPPFVQWLMGLPAGWVTDPQIGLARTAALRVLGNGVVPHQAAMALRLLLCLHRWPARP